MVWVSFNSLFEMRITTQTAAVFGGITQYTFNSLFEMQLKKMGFEFDPETKLLSILYLRCGFGQKKPLIMTSCTCG